MQYENDEDTLATCDICYNQYHIDCLSPRLNELPSEEWFCHQCKGN